MIEKKESDYKSLNRTLFSLALLMLMISLYFLFSNHIEDYLYTQNSYHKSETIGEVLSYDNDIRVKPSNSLSWKKINRVTSLQTGDGVFTGAESQTRVRMKDGDIIDVQQNTMVVFAKSKGRQVANLLQGTFKVSVQKSMKIKIQGKETEIKAENSQIEITVAKDSAPVVKVLEGKAEITDDSNKVIEIAENQTVELEKPTEESIAPTPMPPEPHQWSVSQTSHLVLNGSEKIILTYNKKNEFEKVVLEVSKDAEFKNSTVHTELHNNTGSIVTELMNEGVYFLRLKSNDPETKLSSISDNMAASVLRPPLPEAPIPLQKELTLEQHEKALIEWKPSDQAVRYQVTTRNKDGEEVIHNTDQRTFEWLAEEIGSHFITLKAIDAYKRLSSSTERIKILVLPPKHVDIDRGLAATESEIRYEVDKVFSYKNRNYTKSFVEVEGATATAFSKEVLSRGGNGALLALMGVRVRHWADFNYGYEGFFRTKVANLNSEFGTPAPVELEGRFNMRTHTDFNPFSSLRKSQFKFFTGLQYYKNSGSSDYSPQYQMVKVGGGFLFPVGSQFETSGEASLGIGLDSSKRYEASGQFLWYLLNDFSSGLGYRVYLFESGSTKSAPRGVPYREGAVEVLFMMRYRY